MRLRRGVAGLDLLLGLQTMIVLRDELLDLIGHGEQFFIDHHSLYDGPTKIQILPPEQMEIANEGQMEDGPTIYYKPPEEQKQRYLEDPDVPAEIKEKIQTEGKIPLNQDPMKLSSETSNPGFHEELSKSTT